MFKSFNNIAHLLNKELKAETFFLFSDDSYNKVENDFINLFNNNKNNSLFQKMTNFDIKYFLPSLLHVEDRVSMNFGLESRVPFLDNQLIDFILKLPSKISNLFFCICIILKIVFVKGPEENL